MAITPDLAGTNLAGRRVLVVENDVLIAMMVEDMLADLGCEVLGPAGGPDDARALLETAGRIDVALIDVHLGGRSGLPIADVLRGRGVPLIFSTGAGRQALRESDRDCTVLDTPYRQPDLASALADALRTGSGG
jgi:CheY-like chemotaxis protein